MSFNTVNARRLLAGAIPALLAGAQAGAEPASLDRTVLPVQQPAPPVYTELDARNAKPPPHFVVSPRFEFAYDGGGPGKGGTGTLLVNGQKVAECRIEHTQADIFSADETADVGIDLGKPVVESIGSESPSRFSGTIDKVTVEVK